MNSAFPADSKNLVLLSDGTGNSSGKAQKTNVWRLFQALDQARITQLAKYDDGVGTSTNKYLAALGGAFGFGLKRNVIDLYKFACRNYRDGDRIYGFGFSRGAFTIRVLVGLIAREGLITYRSEEELNRNARAAYRHYRTHSFRSYSPLVWTARKLRDGLMWAKDRIKGYRPYADVARSSRHVHIHFLGLWDTVEAYGMPNEELKRGIDWVIWPMLFGDLKLSPIVRRACHALSLDDERTTFHPLLWDEVAEAELVDQRKVPRGRLTQVWFAGVHSNVGGGYPEDQLSLVTLEWMMGQAAANGLCLKSNVLQAVSADRSAYAKIYDSRAGLAAYYRYAPRMVLYPKQIHEPILRPRRFEPPPILPIIHGSVLMRMVYGSDAYAPITLPHRFWVLAPDGELLPMEQTHEPLRLESSRNQIAAAPAIRPPEQICEAKAQLMVALKRLARPDRQVIRLVWDTVFWRSALYLLTFALTIVLVIFPWVGKGISAGTLAIPYLGHWLTTGLALTDNTFRGPLANLVSGLSSVIPSWAQPWRRALTDNPLEFVMLCAAILTCLMGSRILEDRIRDRARLAWHQSRKEDYAQWCAEAQRGFRNGAVLALIVLAVGSLLTLILGQYGLIDDSRPIATGFGLTGAIPALMLLVRWMGRPKAAHSTGTHIGSTFALKMARWIRDNRLLIVLVHLFTKRLLPIGFALMLVCLGAVALHRSAFDVASSAGKFCERPVQSSGQSSDPDDEKLGSGQTFRTDVLCSDTGLKLRKGQTYLITLDTQEVWFDQTIPTDVLGFAAFGKTHALATPLKRWWFANWFQPIARIGQFSNDEYLLESTDHVAPRTLASCVKNLQPKERPGVHQKINEIDPELANVILNCDPHGAARTPEDRKRLRAIIKARSSGELYLYVNDAVFAFPGLANTFYLNNSGTASVLVEPYNDWQNAAK